MKNNKYIPVIGLEVHVELKTKSKMFCGCSADYFGQKPNTHVCPVCLGLPGALPVSNKKAIERCIMIGLALNCKINLFSKFDRKNYFYPDLPKGYQISQYDEPFAVNGRVVIARSDTTKQSPSKEIATLTSFARNDSNKKVIRIRRVHMEEDTGKLIHQGNFTLIDFNRSGVALVEIVTEPDFESAEQVVQYLKKLQQIVRYLDVSNADMEKGEMRLEPNISLLELKTQNSKLKTKLPDYKVEVKNINSFRFVEKAIEYEIKRQEEILNDGKTPVQETRGWNETKNATISQRVKEEAQDYRYFPEPDIPPIRWSQSQISNLKSQISELPDEKILRFQKQYNLSEYDSKILTREINTANYFEEAVKIGQKYVSVKTIANWIINKKVDINVILPSQLIQNILNSLKTAAIDTLGLDKIIDKVVLDNPKAIEDYKNGKINVIMFLLGNVMRNLKEKIDPKLIKKKLEEKLTNL